MTNNTLAKQPRDELELAQEANDQYNPFKAVIAVLGILALTMLIMVIAYFVRTRRQKQKALGQQKSKNFAMVELFGGSQHLKGLKDDAFEDIDLKSEERQKKGVTRWSFAQYFAN